jgi:hypothetical protein
MSALLPSPTSRNWREKGEMVGPAVAPLGRWRLSPKVFRLQNLVPRSSKFAVVDGGGPDFPTMHCGVLDRSERLCREHARSCQGMTRRPRQPVRRIPS